MKIIAVCGNASLKGLSEETLELAYETGKAIIDSGYVLACGGLGGIMELACKGARASKNHKPNTIIGILPNYDRSIANPYVDLALPIGFDMARNLSLVSISHAVIAIAGGSGTLNELSASWQLGKLIVALGNEGYANKLGGTKLDDRREDMIYKANSAKEALELVGEKLPLYEGRFFAGIKK
ncbi:TIGR00725 family protein [Helicobacter sp. 11S02629-2]|uniref:TIGR00725 family protein n=1 Tax=Helicobacter sp. 11S02629-2 TaxID=1476195 RepID=UPI000BA5AB59|nr:TIGR00725 family protein [Helicobacter sp. 11S02629-2]PAF45594.1 TIGR00725 family protein [Helicobacter sp. 11S02629-2]